MGGAPAVQIKKQRKREKERGLQTEGRGVMGAHLPVQIKRKKKEKERDAQIEGREVMGGAPARKIIQFT